MKRGGIILCRFPHASAAPSNSRPALVVRSDEYNRKIANLLVAAITSNLVNAADPAHCLIDVSTPEGQSSGLDRNSVVSCINLTVIPPRNFDRKIGGVSEAVLQRVDQCLKRALGIG